MKIKFILGILLLLCLALPSAYAKDLFYQTNPSSIAVASGDTLNAGTALVTGACNVQSITVSNAATAGDYLLVYDALTATGTPKFDIECGTSGTYHIPLHDASFGTGVFVDAVETLSYMHVSVEYTS